MVSNNFSVVFCSTSLWCPIVSMVRPTVSQWCYAVPVVSMVSYSFSLVFSSACGVYGVLSPVYTRPLNNSYRLSPRSLWGFET